MALKFLVVTVSIALLVGGISGEGCDFFEIEKGYLETAGGAQIRCGTWPSLEAAKQECLYNRECDGFSWGPYGDGQGGCLKKNRNGGYNGNTVYSGYHKTLMGCCGGDTLSEGECTPPVPTEDLVSKGKPTTQISVSSGGVPERAVDGNKNTDYRGNSCTHTTKTADPWWQVDLLQSYQLSRVVITNRGDCCGERLSNFVVSVGEDKSIGANPACVKGGSQDQGETRDWPCALKGRFVTIQIVGTGILTVCEVEVYATVAAADGGSYEKKIA